MNGSPERKTSGDAPGAKVSIGTERKKLTQERLKELMDYNPQTGVFKWVVDRNGVRNGGVAGGMKEDGYIRIKIDGRLYYAARLAFLWVDGYFPENQVDHIDRNTSNNAWENLREVSQQCNIRNCGAKKNNKSGIAGVCWDKSTKKWQTTIRGGGKNRYLGIFKNRVQAAKARWEAEKKYNYPNCQTNSSAYLYLKKHGVL